MSKRSTLASFATGLLISAVSATTIAADRITDFSLISADGKFHQLSRYSNQKAVVFIAHDGDSREVSRSVRDINKLVENFQDSPVAFFMIDSTGASDKAALLEAAAKSDIEMPVLIDETQLVAEELGLARAGEVAIVDPESKEVLYVGALNDRFAEGSRSRRAKEHYVQDALTAVLADQEITVAKFAGKGDPIVFEAKQENLTAGVSYTNDVAPILEARCVECHQEGGIAPFAMSNHQTVQGWSPMIRETLYTKRMPPGQIDQEYVNTFHNVNHITPEETQKLIHWIDAGAKLDGDVDPLAVAQRKSTEWINGEPDMIVEIPAQTIPATGTIDYRNLQLPLDLDDDIWVKAVEFKAGDTSVLHHIIAFSYGPNGLNEFEILNQGIGLGAYAPGNELNLYPENAGYPLQKGGGLMLQMHYTSSGKETVDASTIGIYLWDEEPEKPILGGSAAELDIQIPPHDGNHEMVASKTFRKDSYLTMVGPHMHYRGKDARFTLVYPDGKKEEILNVPNYQFNWQKTYDFVEPMFIPAGTEMVLEGTFDNSAQNPYNPDPSVEITWGEQTWQEMFFGFVRYVEADAGE